MSWLKQYFFFLLAAAVILLGMWALAQIAEAPSYLIQEAQAKGLEDFRVEFVMPELKAICASESTGNWTNEPRHWDSNGKVLRGIVNPHDIGQCQINEDVWGEKARAMGLDIYSFNGNRKMANWIYESYGNSPWYLSKAMWNK